MSLGGDPRTAGSAKNAKRRKIDRQGAIMERMQGSIRTMNQTNAPFVPEAVLGRRRTTASRSQIQVSADLLDIVAAASNY